MFTGKVIHFFTLLVFTIICLTYAEKVTKVLQNGTDGYEDCKDSYNYCNTKDQNWGDAENLFHHNCQC